MRKLSFLSILAAGLFGLYSCNSDEKGIMTEGDEMVDFTIQLSMSDLTKTDAFEQDLLWNDECVDPDAIDASLHHLSVIYSTDGGTTVNQIEDLAITVDPQNNVIFSNIKKFKSGVTVTVMDVKLHDADHNVLYSTVYKTASNKYLSLIPETSYIMPKDYSISVYNKEYHDIFLLCASKTTTEDDFGYIGFDVEAAQIFCFDYLVNICGVPCEPSAPMKHSVAKGIFKIQKLVDGVASGDAYTSEESGVGKLGEICFTDYGKISDDRESFEITFIVNDVLTYSKVMTLDEVREIEAKVKESDNKLLHFFICPDSWNDPLDLKVKIIDGDNDEVIGEIEFTKVVKDCGTIIEDCVALSCLTFDEINAYIGWVPSVTPTLELLDNEYIQEISLNKENPSFIWETQMFKYTAGQVVDIEAFYYKESATKSIDIDQLGVVVTAYDSDDKVIFTDTKDIYVTHLEDYDSWQSLIFEMEEIESQCIRLVFEFKFLNCSECNNDADLKIRTICIDEAVR